MALAVAHAYTSTIPDDSADSAAGKITPTRWNDAHALTGIASSAQGGTGNGFTKFSGPTTAERTFTLPDADASLAILGANTFTAKQTITPAANTSALAVSGYSVTGSGTTPLIDLAGTWNTSGAASGIKLLITRTAASAAAKLLDVATDAGNGFSVAGLGALSSTLNGVVCFRTDGTYGLIINSANYGLCFASSGVAAPDVVLTRGAAGVVSVMDGGFSAFRDIKVRDVIINGATNLLKTSAALTDNAGAQIGTLTNAPAAGNPTKWVRIDDNGTARFIPCW